jgi:dUTP pyrophosphatase
MQTIELFCDESELLRLGCREKKMRVKLLDPKAKVPTVAHPGFDLGYDLYALDNVLLYNNSTEKVRTGVIIEFPEGYGGIVKDRSSMALNYVTTSGGVIDDGYQGEMCVLMTYRKPDVESPNCYKIRAGDKIAQIIPVKVMTHEEVVVTDYLRPSVRGDKGFGSSGQ